MASFIKSKLKASREYLGRKDYNSAVEAASQVLEYEPANYNANVFLGLAYLELGDHEKSEQAYNRAIQSSPEQILAWQGLSKFYERTNRWTDCGTTLLRLAELFSQQEDSLKCAETLQKHLEFQRSRGTREQLINALSLFLPDSPFYPILSTLPEPEPTAPTSTSTYAVQDTVHNLLPTLEEIVSLTEVEEDRKIKKEVDRRRMRLGAGRPEEIRAEVGREVWESSKLPFLYEEILNHPRTSDDLRRTTESKLLRLKYSHLEALTIIRDNSDSKRKVVSEVVDLSRGAVLLEIPDELAWMFFIEGQDAYDIEDYGYRTLRQFIRLFPTLPLARMLRGYFNYMRLPVDLEVSKEANAPENPDDDYDPFSDVLDASTHIPNYLLAHRILVKLYLLEADYENTIKTAESGLEQLNKTEAIYIRRALQVSLVVGLVDFYPPKHHSRAAEILSDVLGQDGDNIPCLMSQGYILQYRDQWTEAENTFRQVEALKPDDDIALRAKEEQAWCAVKDGRLEQGIAVLREVVQTRDASEGNDDQKARAWWRLGKSLWDYEVGDREVAYKHFITSLKRCSTFAPAYTSLGVYYAEVASPPDLDRSSKCFQKAFELDAREAEAARRLAEAFAEEREWDLVEVVARRTMEGEGGLEGGSIGMEKYSSTKYQPTNAWAWKAIGGVELVQSHMNHHLDADGLMKAFQNRHHYAVAAQSFQVALRADQDDFHSWQKLGDAYAKCGRHAAAAKALKKASALRPDDWMCLYLLGDISRVIGEYTDAIEVFEGILTHHPDEICVSLTLIDTYLSHARSQAADGFRSRAEASAVASLLMGVGLLDRTHGFRRVVWKYVADAVFELSRSVTFSDVALVGSALGSLASLINGKESHFVKEIIDLPQVIDGEHITGLTALELAVALYDNITSLDNRDNVATGTAYFDLAMALTRYGMQTTDQAKTNMAFNQAKDLVQKALVTDPGNRLYWTLLGDLNFVEHPKMSQHAYIKALECDPKNASTWTNLGLLYFQHGDTELANQALYRAQILDSEYALAWVGQGLAAAANGHEADSYALFAHASNSFSNMPIADLEYAKRAFHRLADPNTTPTPPRDALLTPFHALDRYCKQRPNDAAALHLFALVCERLGQIQLALDLVSRTTSLLEQSYEETEDSNTEEHFALASGTLGRLCLANGDFAGAVEAFTSALSLLSAGDDMSQAKIVRAHAQFGSGLAHFRLGELEIALQMLESALEGLPSEMVNVRGHITVLLAQTLWALGGDDARQTARGQLLECVSADPENLTALTALVAMGISDSDDLLVTAALSEIQALTLDKRVELDPGQVVSKLLVQHHLAQGREKDALSEAKRATHVKPFDYTSRRTLASLLLQRKNGGATAIISGIHSAPQRDSMHEILRISAIAAVTDAKVSDSALRLAQKAVVMAPWTVANWRALAYVRCASSDD